MNSALEKMFENATSLPQIPKVVRDITDALRNDEVEVAQLAALARQDQVISAKVLRLANSSYYGSSGKVATIEDAITLIGLKPFNTLITASGVMAAFPKIPALDLNAFWRHSLLLANVARALAKHRKLDGEQAFTAALMSGIGILLSYIAFPDGAARVTSLCKGTSVGERRAVERHELHFDHCEAGAELAKRWHFPAETQEIIAHYCTPDSGSAIAHLVYVAVGVAQGIEANATPEQMLQDIPAGLAAELKLDLDWFESRKEAFAQLKAEAASLV